MDPVNKKKYAKNWSRWENKTSQLGQPLEDKHALGNSAFAKDQFPKEILPFEFGKAARNWRPVAYRKQMEAQAQDPDQASRQDPDQASGQDPKPDKKFSWDTLILTRL